MKRFELMFYIDKELNNPVFIECWTKESCFNKLNKIKNNQTVYEPMITKRNIDWEIVETYLA